VVKLEKTVPIVQDKAKVFKRGHVQNVAYEKYYLERKKVRIQQKADIATQTHQKCEFCGEKN